MNAAGKEPSPAIPSPAFFVWGAPNSDSPIEESTIPTTNTAKANNQTNSKSFKDEFVPNAAQKTPSTESVEEPGMMKKITSQVITQTPSPPPINDDTDNFPSLGGNNFPSLSSAAPSNSPSKRKGKKGRGKKGQQILNMGVQRMSIN